jgi:uncharacterized membrane protein YgdD (TMEM256/DUF423 family)
MSNSTNFKAAHAMTKQVIQTGDNYQATFGACLKVIMAETKQSAVNVIVTNINFAILATIVMMIVNLVKAYEDSPVNELVIMLVIAIFNPFSLIIFNGLYLNITG